jgi:group II intron reverse transcriptase/maturase
MATGIVRYDQVCDGYTLQRAWAEVRGGRTAAARQQGAGVDGLTVADWEADWENRLAALQADLLDGAYRPSRLLWFDVPRREAGQVRRLGIPTVTDRVVQRAVKNLLEPIWEQEFLSCSHGFRPERSVFTAVAHVLWHEAQGLRWVADADLESYFDTVQHDPLLGLVAATADEGILALIAAWLDVHRPQPEAAGRGIAQGATLSPLLANIYLHPFDVAMVEAGLALVRFADDWVVMCAGPRQAMAALDYAAALLADMGLALNPDKTAVRPCGPGFSFLGAHFRL